MIFILEVVKTAVCSRKVNASVCRWSEEESVRSTDFSRHDDCKESAALDVCGERKTESLGKTNILWHYYLRLMELCVSMSAEQVESEDEEETLSCLDAQVTTSRDPGNNICMCDFTFSDSIERMQWKHQGELKSHQPSVPM